MGDVGLNAGCWWASVGGALALAMGAIYLPNFWLSFVGERGT
jgi:hypothetical protein